VPAGVTDDFASSRTLTTRALSLKWACLIHCDSAGPVASSKTRFHLAEATPRRRTGPVPCPEGRGASLGIPATARTRAPPRVAIRMSFRPGYGRRRRCPRWQTRLFVGDFHAQYRPQRCLSDCEDSPQWDMARLSTLKWRRRERSGWTSRAITITTPPAITPIVATLQEGRADLLLICGRELPRPSAARQRTARARSSTFVLACRVVTRWVT
jgi:hypothetical protein